MFKDENGDVWATEAEEKILKEMFKAYEQELLDRLPQIVGSAFDKARKRHLGSVVTKQNRKVRFELEYDRILQTLTVIEPKEGTHERMDRRLQPENG